MFFVIISISIHGLNKWVDCEDRIKWFDLKAIISHDKHNYY